MDARLRRPRAVAMAFLGAALVASGPWIGWWTILLIALGWLVSVVGISIGVLGTGSATSPAKSWPLVPALALPARFHRRGLYAGVAITMLALVAVTIVSTPAEVADDPQLFLFPAALIAAAMAVSMALRSAEIQHHTESVIDQLTGMQVNDRYGHGAGDAVLKDVAYRMRKALRAYDLAYRLGEDPAVATLTGVGAPGADGVGLGRAWIQ